MRRDVRIRIVDATHYAVSVACSRNFRGSAVAWERICDDSAVPAFELYASHAAIATCNGGIVGAFRYRVLKASTLKACGTWVFVPYRADGVAWAMWRRVIHAVQPARISVYTATYGGAQFVESIRARIYAHFSCVQALHHSSENVRWLRKQRSA